MNAVAGRLMQRRAGLRPRLWWSLPPRIRRELSVNTSPAARILEIEAVDELATSAPIAPADETAILETYERADPVDDDPDDAFGDAADNQCFELRKPCKPDYSRFAEAVRTKPRPAPAPVHEVPVERAVAAPTVGRTHTNGYFGAKYDLRDKGLLIDCSQCDRALTRTEAAVCRSPFCKAKSA